MIHIQNYITTYISFYRITIPVSTKNGLLNTAFYISFSLHPLLYGCRANFWPICPEHVVLFAVFFCIFVMCYKSSKSCLQIIIFIVLLWEKNHHFTGEKIKAKYLPVSEIQPEKPRSAQNTDLMTKVTCESPESSSTTKRNANISHWAFKNHRTSIYLLKTDISKLSSIRHKAVDKFISETCNCLNRKNLFPFLSFIHYNVF